MITKGNYYANFLGVIAVDLHDAVLKIIQIYLVFSLGAVPEFILHLK